MLINQDNYRAFPAVSNSDLGMLQKYWLPEDRIIDLERAYAQGTLIDAMLTEPNRVNYFKLTVQGESYPYTKDDFARAEKMKIAAQRDPFIAQIIKIAEFQKISYNPAFEIEYDGLKFMLPMKCKWDAWVKSFDMSGDFKSTTCTTQQQAEAALEYFNYDRQAALYMDLGNKSQFMLMFISKVNFQVFKVAIKKGDALYKSGKAKYQKLAFEWWSLFHDIELQPKGIIYTPEAVEGNTIVLAEGF
jgi:hypothetical protein